MKRADGTSGTTKSPSGRRAIPAIAPHHPARPDRDAPINSITTVSAPADGSAVHHFVPESGSRHWSSDSGTLHRDEVEIEIRVVRRRHLRIVK